MPDVEVFHQVIEEWLHDPDSPVGVALEERAIAVESAAKALVLVPGTGRFYPAGPYFLTRGHGPTKKVYHWVRATPHQASAPGEPPSSDTGRLLTSIGHEVTSGDSGTIQGRVIANVEYAKWLELGTRYMDERPFLRPALHSVMG